MQAGSSSTTSRRHLLGQFVVGTAAGAGVLNYAAEAAVLDPHPFWKERVDGLLREMNAGWPDDFTMDLLTGELARLRDLIAETPARTRAGLVAQLEAELLFLEQEGQSVDEARQALLLRNAIAALEALA